MPNQTGRLSEISLLISSICCCWWCSVWFRCPCSAYASAIALFRFVIGDDKVVPDHIGGGQGWGRERKWEADETGEQDGSDPDNLLTIKVQQVQPWQERAGAEGGFKRHGRRRGRRAAEAGHLDPIGFEVGNFFGPTRPHYMSKNAWMCKILRFWGIMF